MDYAEDIAKYTDKVDKDIVAARAKNLALVMRNQDSSLVSANDESELDTVRKNFADKKLGLSPEETEKGLEVVLEKMKGVTRKNRVTFYYLLAEATGKLDKLS